MAGTTATCQGDVSAGLVVNGPTITTLNVNNVAAPGIMPADAVDGVFFITPDGNTVTIDVDTGPFGILTSSTNLADTAHGIFGGVLGNGNVTIFNMGNITTTSTLNDSNGIIALVFGSGNATVSSTGNISTMGVDADGIFANVNGDGNATVTSTGNLSTTGNLGTGIDAFVDGNGNSTVTSNGTISTQGDFAAGIVAEVSGNGNTTVNSTGDISTRGDVSDSIVVELGGNGNVTVNSSGNLSTMGMDSDGVIATITGDGNATVSSDGNINTAGDLSDGIDVAVLGNGNATVFSNGNISIGGNGADGIDAEVNGDGNATTFSTGNISTIGTDSQGIDVEVDGNGNATAFSTGNIATAGSMSSAVTVEVEGNGNATAFSTGKLSTTGFDADGIFAVLSGNGNATVASNGDITTTGNSADGIDAIVQGNGNTTVTSIGNISTSGSTADGIDAEVDGNGNATVFSTGNISTIGAVSDGIDAEVDGNGNATVFSTGNVSTQGDMSTAISAETEGSGNVTLTSVGGISTSGSNSNGILALLGGGGFTTVTSTGNISTTGNNSNGILAALGGNGDVNVTSTGDIQTQGQNANGIAVASGNFTNASGTVNVSSTGDISTRGQGASGINIALLGISKVFVENQGDINAAATGILLQSATRITQGTFDRATINNSGLIRGGNGFAINLAGDGSDTLNLLPGSQIDGAIDFGNGNDGMGGTNPADVDTLNIAEGVSAVLTFADAGGSGQGDSDLESAPEIINLLGPGFLIDQGTRVVAVSVDKTDFAAQGIFISDLTSSIAGIIDDSDAALAESPGLQTVQGFGSVAEGTASHGVRLWGSVFGGHHDVAADNGFSQFNNNYIGLVSGIEHGDALVDGAFGLLGGYGHSDISLAFDASGTEVDSYFGGVYWKRDYGTHRINAAFVVGATDNDLTRRVANGNAESDFDGVFYTPSLSVAMPVDLPTHTLLLSGRANYVHLNLDGYTETGIPLPITIGDRDVSVVNLRGQVSLPFSMKTENEDDILFKFSIGVDSTIDAGSDDINAVVAATPFGFSAETQDEASGFLGLDIHHTAADGRTTFGLNGELLSAFDGGFEANGEVKASLRF